MALLPQHITEDRRWLATVMVLGIVGCAFSIGMGAESEAVGLKMHGLLYKAIAVACAVIAAGSAGALLFGKD